MLSQIHEHLRATMVVIDHSWISAGRNYRAALEISFMLQRVAKQFVQFLRRTGTHPGQRIVPAQSQARPKLRRRCVSQAGFDAPLACTGQA